MLEGAGFVHGGQHGVIVLVGPIEVATSAPWSPGGSELSGLGGVGGVGVAGGCRIRPVGEASSWSFREVMFGVVGGVGQLGRTAIQDPVGMSDIDHVHVLEYCACSAARASSDRRSGASLTFKLG